MTNEEIIRCACTLFNDKLGPALPDALGSVIACCINTKDQQFKEYLEKKQASAQKAYLESTNEDEDYLCGRSDCIAEIINEFFKEETV